MPDDWGPSLNLEIQESRGAILPAWPSKKSPRSQQSAIEAGFGIHPMTWIQSLPS